MKKLYILSILFLLGLSAYAHDIAVENDDGVFIYYNYKYNYSDDIMELEVTYVGNYSDVVIPEKVNYDEKTYTVTSIGINAFYLHKELSSVRMPNSIKSIDRGAFNQCINLKTVVMSNNLTSIGESAFYDCGSLPSIDIPSSVERIEADAFLYCGGLKSVNITDLSKWCSISFASYISNPLLYAQRLFLNGEEIKDMVIPEDVYTISDNAFYGFKTLNSVTLPNSLHSIGAMAFGECSGLASITIPQSVNTIGSNAFYKCTNLNTINILNDDVSIGAGAFSTTGWYNNQPNGIIYMGNVAYECKGIIPDNTTIDIKEGTTKIAPKLFYQRYGLVNVNLPNSLKEIGSEAFYRCENLESVIIPDSVVTIGASAFGGCVKLSSVTIPKNVTSIEDGVFHGCSSLGSINIIGDVVNIGAYAFYGCNSLLSIEIPITTTAIGAYAFYGCEGIKSIIIPDSVKSVGERCFENCKSLEFISIGKNCYLNSNYNHKPFDGCNNINDIILDCDFIDEWFKEITTIKRVTFGNNVRIIDYDAFKDCKGLTSVCFHEGLISISPSAFSGCDSLSSVSFPNSLESIGEYAFYGCKTIPQITIPKNVTAIKRGAFANCSGIITIIVDSENEHYDSRDNCNAIIETNTNKIIAGCKNTVITESIAEIEEQSFENCTDLTSINIPKNIYKIGLGAFSGCSSLLSINVKKGNEFYDSRDNCNAIIETEKNKLILACSNTKIPESVIEIARYSFYGCSSMTTLYIPQNINKIDDYAFIDCTGLSEIVVAPENKKFDSRDNCNAIIETEKNKLILACSNTKIPENVTSISSHAFRNCVTFSLPDGMTKIPYGMFSQCDKLEYIKMPPSLKVIPESAFNDCSSLKTVVFEDGPDSLIFEVLSPAYYSKPEWFNSCPLDSVYIGRNIKYDFKPGGGYGTFFLSPFRERKTLRKVVFGENVTTIQNAMFSGCANLTSVDVPEEMDSIGGGAFSECENLTSFALPYGIKTIGSQTFYNCKSLGSIKIPESVSFIGESAFYGCEGLQSIDIPNSVNEIELKAFCCKNLSKIRFEDSDKHLLLQQKGGYDVFAGCPITDIYLGRNIINRSYNYIYSSLAYFKTPFNLVVGKNVTEIIGGTFAECEKILSATFEEGLDTLFFINDHNAYNSIMPFSKSAIDSVYMGRVIVGKDNYYPGSTPIPFSNVDSSFVMRIGNNISEIGDNSYSNWNIAAVIIPNNVMKIASTAFQHCYTLNNLTIEDGLEPLDFMEGDNFYACQLRNVYLGRNMKYSGDSPFNRNKEGITSLTFGDNVTEIPQKAFIGLKNLNQLILPASLTKIGKMAFYGCEGLTDLSIPGNVTEIGQQAFDLCRGLKKLTFEDGSEELTFTADPNNLNNSFCNSPLEEIYMGRDFVYKDSSPFFALEPLKTLTFGNNVKNIPNKAFAGCGALKSITIGSNVENIGALAFSACLGLKNVDSYAETAPQVASDAFNNIEVSTIPLKVPENSLEEYWNHPVWSKFWIITEAGAITIKAKDYTRLYGDENPTFEFDTEGAELKGVPSITCSAKPISPVGKYNIEVTRGTVANYEANYVDGTLTITKAPLTISVGEYTMNQYEPMPEFEIVYEGFKNGETESVLTSKPTITCEANEESAPGEYDIILSGAEAENYEMQYVVGKLIINEPASYNLIYMVDGEEYQSFNLKTRDSITPLEEPKKEGYTFSGWSEIPETMPNHDVVVTGIFTVNSYTVRFMYGDKVLHTEEVNYGEAIPLPELEDEYGLPIKWLDVPETMPAHDIVILVDETDAIGATLSNGEPFDVYSVDGKKIRHQVTSLKGLRSGMYIINGRKVMVK